MARGVLSVAEVLCGLRAGRVSPQCCGRAIEACWVACAVQCSIVTCSTAGDCVCVCVRAVLRHPHDAGHSCAVTEGPPAHAPADAGNHCTV